MGTASLTITDLETSTTLTLQLADSGGSESDSPPSSDQTVEKARAIVAHDIPGADYPKGQDMGILSLRVNLGGIGQAAVVSQLESWLDVPQFTSGHPSGRFTLTMVDRFSSTSWTYTPMTFKAFSKKMLKGSPKWFSYTATFEKFNQT